MWKLKLTYFYVKFFYSLIFNKLWKPGGGRVRAPSSGGRAASGLALAFPGEGRERWVRASPRRLWNRVEVPG